MTAAIYTECVMPFHPHHFLPASKMPGPNDPTEEIVTSYYCAHCLMVVELHGEIRWPARMNVEATS